jgi:TPR repeat protein
MRLLLILMLAAAMTGCASNKQKTIPNQPKITSPATVSELAQGKRLFQDGYYKKAMEQLLPLAAEGNMEAQYAVGYMYYYGYGTTQDTTSGIFWIQRSANQHFEPAIKALTIVQQEQLKNNKAKHPSPNF